MTEAPTCPFNHHAIGDSEGALKAYEDLREQGVVYSPENGGYYVLSKYEHVFAALRDPDTFASGMGTRIPAIGDTRIIPLDTDPPVHTDYRALITDRITPESVRTMSDGLRELVDQLVDEFYAKGGGDWVTEVGLPLPLNVLIEVVGFAPETVKQFRALTDESWEQITEKDVLEARAGLHDLVRTEIRRHRETDLDDYITTLLSREIDGRPITDSEAEKILLAFAIAGHETTMHTSGWIVRHLVEDPSQQARLRERPEEIPAFVEEVLRHSSPVQSMGRCTTRDTEIGGVQIPAGSRVLLIYGSANHDSDRFDHPAQFDADRSAAGHLAFGFGRHQCAGALLARTELRLVLEKLITLPYLEYAGTPDWGTLGGGTMHGPVSLPVRFVVEAAPGPAEAVIESSPSLEEAESPGGNLVTVASASEILELDLDRCSGYGNCVFAAPDMFELDLSSNLPVLLKDEWSDADRASLEAAVADCPAAALKLRRRQG